MKMTLFALLCHALTAVPAWHDSPRGEILLNGRWDTVLNVADDAIPTAGWTPRRVPAMPIITTPPTTAAWYRYQLSVPREWIRKDRRFLLHLDRVGHYAAIYCNGKRVAAHYGQFTPVEADLTATLRAGANDLALYVHDASGKYGRPGVELTSEQGNGYRGASDRPEQRNWIGITGDISLVWRPAAHIAAVHVMPSVRKKRLTANIELNGVASAMTLRAAVLDGSQVVLTIPQQKVGSAAAASLDAAALDTEWANPVLWGHAPYGSPKLYQLRLELYSGAKLIDRRFQRFGFREVWVEGRDAVLNGRKLWMSGAYFRKLAPVRYINDRRPQSLILEIMQASGLNTLHGHWDDLGEAWMDRCDEAGMLVLAGFYCDGRPLIQSRADDGWMEWMGDTATQWARTVRNHPSIVMWRPIDIGPINIVPRNRDLANLLRASVGGQDGTRPFAYSGDGNEIDAWSQSPLKNPQAGVGKKKGPAPGPGDYDDGSRMQAAFASTGRPFLTKEIYTGFADFENTAGFFRTFYEKSAALGGAGVITQHIPLIRRAAPFRVRWLSESGEGNRDQGDALPQDNLPNWSDPSQPVWTPSNYSALFADLYRKIAKQEPAAARAEVQGEVLITGLHSGDFAVLVPVGETAEPRGVRAATDGTAWIVANPGAYRLIFPGGAKQLQIKARLSHEPVPRIHAH